MKRLLLPAVLLSLVWVVGCQKNEPVANNSLPPSLPGTPGPSNVEAPPPTVVEPAPEPLPPVTASPLPPKGHGKTYTVHKGDTFYAIARKVYGNASKAKEIQAANPGVEPGKLKVGQKINLPD